MSTFIFNCPKCQEEIEAPTGHDGESVNCPSCSAEIKVPRQQSSAKKIVINRRGSPATYQSGSRPATGAPQRTASATTQQKQSGGTGCAGWVCLALSCAFMFVPFAGIFIGGCLAFVAFVLAIVVLAKGEVGSGIALLLCSLILPPIFGVIASVLGIAILAGMGTI